MALERAIPERESLTVEFKSDRRRLSDAELVAAAVCLANTDGGAIFLGVEDDGTITGLHPEHRNLAGLSAMIANRTNPRSAYVRRHYSKPIPRWRALKCRARCVLSPHRMVCCSADGSNPMARRNANPSIRTSSLEGSPISAYLITRLCRWSVQTRRILIRSNASAYAR